MTFTSKAGALFALVGGVIYIARSLGQLWRMSFPKPDSDSQGPLSGDANAAPPEPPNYFALFGFICMCGLVGIATIGICVGIFEKFSKP